MDEIKDDISEKELVDKMLNHIDSLSETIDKMAFTVLLTPVLMKSINKKDTGIDPESKFKAKYFLEKLLTKTKEFEKGLTQAIDHVKNK